MKGLLIYDNEGAKRNKWFISRLIESASSHAHELELVIYSDTPPSADCDFAIIRTIDPKLNKHFEERGIPTFNNAKTSKIANDKWQTYLFAKELEIPLMHTESFVTYESAQERCGSPFVLKATDGHGGSEVFLVDNKHKCEELLSLLGDKKLIAQAMCSEPGVDMRVYVLGGKVLAAAKRISRTDFRSNFSLGGEAEIVSVPREVEPMIEKVCKALSPDLIGIDFIRHDGKWVLNEIEDVVGTRMLYSLTSLDPADLYIKYIIGKLTEKA